MVRPKFLLPSPRNGEEKVRMSGRRNALGAVGGGPCGALALETEGNSRRTLPSGDLEFHGGKDEDPDSVPRLVLGTQQGFSPGLLNRGMFHGCQLNP